MGNWSSKPLQDSKPAAQTDKTDKTDKTTQESLQDALDVLERGLNIGQPACNEIQKTEVVLARIMPMKPPNPR